MSSLYTADSGSDYGDFSIEEEHILASLADSPQLNSIASRKVTTTARRSDNDSNPIIVDLALAPHLSTDIDANFRPRLISDDSLPEDRVAVTHVDPSRAISRHGRRDPAVLVAQGRSRAIGPDDNPPASPTDNISYPDLSRALSSIRSEDAPVVPRSEHGSTNSTDNPSPLARFRTYPKKPFSVSDFTSGVWCELQYYYTLTRLPRGRRTRTAAMKRGSEVHQTLENQVHTTVRVEIATKEDMFGLKIWNIIQGLRTLRDTGLTREIEVWGVVDGNVVNGIIDGLSYDDPDPAFEKEVFGSQGAQGLQGKGLQGTGLQGTMPRNQQSIEDFFQPDKQSTAVPPPSWETEGPKIHLFDVKTRGKACLPAGADLRPTKIQLFLYHRFLSDMASDKLDFFRVFDRYGLDPDKVFSDSFLAQMASLSEELFYDAASHLSTDSDPVPDPVPSSTASSTGQAEHSGTSTQTNGPSSTPSSSPGSIDLLQHTTLRSLVPLARRELRAAFPRGAASIGTLVSVEYRARADGAAIGTNVFPVDDAALDAYLAGDLEWWRGKRAPRGVPLDEAYKCHTCEFADACVWRREMDEVRLRGVRARLAQGKGEEEAVEEVGGAEAVVVDEVSVRS